LRAVESVPGSSQNFFPVPGAMSMGVQVAPGGASGLATIAFEPSGVSGVLGAWLLPLEHATNTASDATVRAQGTPMKTRRRDGAFTAWRTS
jgi:hypothetical protein